MIGLKRLALLKHGAPPRNVLEAALRAKWGGGGASYEKTVGPAPIISISDAKAKPAKSLIVGMEPIQDLHGYDNPWPAGGGKNLWNPQPYTGLNYNIDVGRSVTLTESTGVTVNGNKLSFSVPTTWDYKDFKTKPLAAGTYRIHFSNSLESGFRGTWYVVGDTGAGDVIKQKETFSSIAGDRDKNVTVETNDYIVLQVASVNVTTMELVDWQIESGSSYTSWSPYENICPISGRTGLNVYHSGEDTSNPAIYPISWQTEAGTVYGGTVDLVSGVLTVDRAKHIVSSGQGWAKSSSYPGGFYRTRMLSEGTAKEFTPFMCSHAESVANLSQYIKGTCYCDGSINIRIMDSDATYEDWNTYCVNQYNSGTPIEICYELATPITYQLTPQQIQLLKGSNTLWSDADDLTLTYIGTTPPNLLGGMLGGGFGGVYTPTEEEPEEEEQVPEEEQVEGSDPEEVIPGGE